MSNLPQLFVPLLTIYMFIVILERKANLFK